MERFSRSRPNCEVLFQEWAALLFHKMIFHLGLKCIYWGKQSWELCARKWPAIHVTHKVRVIVAAPREAESAYWLFLSQFTASLSLKYATSEQSYWCCDSFSPTSDDVFGECPKKCSRERQRKGTSVRKCPPSWRDAAWNPAQCGRRKQGPGKRAGLASNLALSLLTCSFPPSLPPSLLCSLSTRGQRDSACPSDAASRDTSLLGWGWEGWMSCCHGNNDLTWIAWFLLCGLSKLQCIECSHTSQTGRARILEWHTEEPVPSPTQKAFTPAE